MMRITEEEASLQIEALKRFEFWNQRCYDDCIAEEDGFAYIGETAGCNWLVSASNGGKCLVTVHGRNYRFNSKNSVNSFLISHFTDIILLAIEEA